MKPGFSKQRGCHGFTLAEICAAVSLIALSLLIVQMGIMGLLRKSTFKSQIQDFVSTMQMAIAAASESDHRYEVIIDTVEQTYLLREITTSDLYDVQEEEIIHEASFGANCRVDYVTFDDGDTAMGGEDRIRFRAGHAGWQYGGKIVFVDDADQPFSVVVNRLNRVVELLEGDVDIWMPKTKEDLLF